VTCYAPFSEKIFVDDFVIEGTRVKKSNVDDDNEMHERTRRKLCLKIRLGARVASYQNVCLSVLSRAALSVFISTKPICFHPSPESATISSCYMCHLNYAYVYIRTTWHVRCTCITLIVKLRAYIIYIAVGILSNNRNNTDSYLEQSNGCAHL
jgi:hypothetical protein